MYWRHIYDNICKWRRHRQQPDAICHIQGFIYNESRKYIQSAGLYV